MQCNCKSELTLGSSFSGVVCLMKDLMTPVRPKVDGVIMSIWFFCTVWRKDLMLGRTAWKGTARGGRVDVHGGRQGGEMWWGGCEGVTLQMTQFQVLDRKTHLRRFLTDWLFLGGENLLVGLPSTVSGALRFVLRLDLISNIDHQLTHWPLVPLTCLEVTNTYFRADCCFSATTGKWHKCSLSTELHFILRMKYLMRITKNPKPTSVHWQKKF